MRTRFTRALYRVKQDYRRLLRVGGLCAVVTTVLGLPATTNAAYAPIDAKGPALGIPPAKLAASLSCSGDLEHATREPVLLTAATTVTTAENFSWNYVPAFKAAGIA